MAKCNPTKDYTKVPNSYLRDKTLSLKAKGLITQILSLPEDWRLSIAVFEGMNSDGQAAVSSAIKELEAHGYLERRTIRRGAKILKVDYIIHISQQTQDDINMQILKGLEDLNYEKASDRASR